MIVWLTTCTIVTLRSSTLGWVLLTGSAHVGIFAFGLPVMRSIPKWRPRLGNAKNHVFLPSFLSTDHGYSMPNPKHGCPHHLRQEDPPAATSASIPVKRPPCDEAPPLSCSWSRAAISVGSAVQVQVKIELHGNQKLRKMMVETLASVGKCNPCSASVKTPVLETPPHFSSVARSLGDMTPPPVGMQSVIWTQSSFYIVYDMVRGFSSHVSRM